MGLGTLCSRRVLWLLMLLIMMISVGCGAETAVLTPTPFIQPTSTMTPTTISTTPPTPGCAPRTELPLRYLALGDSYTIGESVADGERWPVQLVTALRQQDVNIADPEIIAKTGWTTAELVEGIKQAAPEKPYDVVSLLIGVNNQYRGLSQEAYQEEFVGLLETAVFLADDNPNRVFVVSIPDWGVTPFGQNRDFREVSAAIDAFNAINQAETESRNIAYIDITDISRLALTDRVLIADDGLHPSGEMYRLWVEQMQPVVCRLLSPN